MFKNKSIGFKLLVAHILGSITVGLLFKNKFISHKPCSIVSQKSIKTKSSETLNAKNLGKFMNTSIQNSFSTLIMIGGYIVFFAIVRSFFIKTRHYYYHCTNYMSVFLIYPTHFCHMLKRLYVEY